MEVDTIVAGLIFGCLGLFSWRVGRRRDDARRMLLGAGLILLPMVVDGWWLWGGGTLLGVLVFWP